jgi:EAL domain-containing protein (putative c-di-GMP-specific phosphodiesterase class I)
LRRGLGAGEFVGHLQPIVDLRSGSVTAVEAFARWQHPTRGLLTPAEFLPWADADDLVGAVDSWLLEAALAHAAGPGPANGLTVCVNTSARALSDPAFAATTLRLLQGSKLAPTALALVVTETRAMVEFEPARVNIDALRLAGVTIHLDDFGIGYSSLSHVDRLPIDAIKIDRSFVHALVADANTASAVAAVAAGARGHGWITIADGVESAEQADVLAVCGVDCAQGDFYSPPRSIRAFEHWMTQDEIFDSSTSTNRPVTLMLELPRADEVRRNRCEQTRTASRRTHGGFT